MATKAKDTPVKTAPVVEESLFGKPKLNEELKRLVVDVDTLRLSLAEVVEFVQQIRAEVRKLNESIEL